MVLQASSGSERSSVIVATELSEIEHQVLAMSQFFSTRDQKANRISKKQTTFNALQQASYYLYTIYCRQRMGRSKVTMTNGSSVLHAT
jgi:hypothetical protein